MNWATIICGGLFVYILYAVFVPPKWYRKKLDEDDTLKAKREARKYVRDVPKGIAINMVYFERGHTSGILTKRIPQAFIFSGIIRGDFSQTIYLRVDQDGKLYDYETDIVARATYEDSDLGIVAVTVSDGQIRFRDVPPKGINGADMVKVRFNFMTSS